MPETVHIQAGNPAVTSTLGPSCTARFVWGKEVFSVCPHPTSLNTWSLGHGANSQARGWVPTRPIP